MSSDVPFFRAALEARLAAPPTAVVAWHLPTADVPDWPWYGLSLMTSGRKRYRGPRGDALVDETLTPGRAGFTTPGVHLEVIGRDAYEQLSLVFRRDCLRCLWFNHRAGAPPLRAPTRWLHTARPMDAGGWHLLQALTAEAAGADHLLRVDLLRGVLRWARRELDRTPDVPTSATTFQAACAHLHEHHHLPLTRSDVARTIGISPGHLSLLFARHAGTGFHRYLVRLRMEHAARLVRQGGLTNAEIAARCGGGHVAAFLRLFRQHHGVAPGMMRQR